MKMIRLVAVLATVGWSNMIHAQDLLKKVPEEAQVVMAMNGKAFFKHVDAAEVNKIFQNIGFFDNVFGKKNKISKENIQELGLDLNSKAYIHAQITDSVQYIGVLFPIANVVQLEEVLPKDKKIQTVDGLKTMYTSDGTLRMSWDDNTLYFLGAVPMFNYFNKEEIRTRYGLKEDPKYNYDDAAAATTVEAYPDTVYVDTTITAVEVPPVKQGEIKEVEFEEGEEFIVPPASPPAKGTEIEEDEYAYVDSVLERDEYQDDYYKVYAEVSQHNDSVKNVLMAQWVNQRFTQILDGKIGYSKSKTFSRMNDDELMRLEMKNFNDFYSLYYPMDLFYGTFGAKPIFDYGYESLAGSLIVDGPQLKFVGDLGLDKEMTKYFKDIYKNKFNPKFFEFLDPNALGFISLNMNSEAYIKHMPSLVKKVYGNMAGDKVGNIIDLFATIADVTLDEKALGKVIKGDNLFVVNGVTKQEVKYKDYQYDDDYNYTEVERTKMETLPQFIWMFSSDDTRIFEKIINVGKSENSIEDHGGIFELKINDRSGIKPYLLIDKGIVFLSNDLQKLKDIKSKTFRGKGDASFVSFVKNNPVSMVFNAKQVPSLVKELDIPIHRNIEETINELSQYGNLYFVSKKVKGNNAGFEIGVDFPKTKPNAVSFMVDAINKLTLKFKD